MLYAWHITARHCEWFFAGEPWDKHLEERPDLSWLVPFWRLWRESGYPQFPITPEGMILQDGNSATAEYRQRVLQKFSPAVQQCEPGNPGDAQVDQGCAQPCNACPVLDMLERGGIPCPKTEFDYSEWSTGAWTQLHERAPDVYAWHFVQWVAEWSPEDWDEHRVSDPAHYEMVTGFRRLWPTYGVPKATGCTSPHVSHRASATGEMPEGDRQQHDVCALEPAKGCNEDEDFVDDITEMQSIKDDCEVLECGIDFRV